MKSSAVGCTLFSVFGAVCLLFWAVALKLKIINIPTPNKNKTISIWYFASCVYTFLALLSIYVLITDATASQATLLLDREEARLADRHRSLGGRKLAARVARELAIKDCGGDLDVALLMDENEEAVKRAKVKREKQLEELLRKTTRAN